ncbi:GntR family transcriptional regulator [Acidibrevibacterium fodinaquatile]|uniref:GntR family transcriptional regulator n=1 Tax=Acidibrevibacterium fodinaquatile TaxID=1969806 RepID=UPI0013B3BC8A|nr:GntR family transcriptional regulator [Acidibrevibacterium fodinaquatile]
MTDTPAIETPATAVRRMKHAGRRRPARRPPPLRDQAYDAIKQRIICCELRPGEVLSEALLSETLGFGRTPIHQAIARLAGEGLIEVMSRKGIMIRPESLDDILNIIEVRRLTESLTARCAAERAQAADIRAIEQNLDAMWRAARARDLGRLMTLDGEFHALLALHSRNAVLTEILAMLRNRAARQWFISLRANEQHIRVCEQHAEIVDAVRRHDPDSAEIAMRRHIDAFLDNASKQI